MSPSKSARAAALLAALSGLAAAQSCCDRLSQALPDSIVRPNDTAGAYASLNGRWSDTAILAPSCIFLPASVEQVAAGLQLLTDSGLEGGACKFAIKAGGHMPIPGANNIQGGVVMNLAHLDETTLSADKSYVTLGAGGTWSHAYANLVKDGLAFTGGFCGGTGVGGLSIGGGQSFFQPSQGWVVDNILSYEVVLASGQIVTASADSNPDLYKALKGGGSNFGVVTKVDIATFNFRDMWAGQIVVPVSADATSKVLEAAVNFTGRNNQDVHAGIQIIFSYPSNGTALIDLAMASGVENPPVLQGFTSLQPHVLNTMSKRSLSSFVAEADATQPPGYRVLGATVTFANTLEAIKAVHAVSDVVQRALATEMKDLEFIVNYAPQPRVIATHTSKRGGNVLGLENVDHDQIVAFLTPRWTNASHDEAMYAAAQTWVDRCNDALLKIGSLDPFVYVNFATPQQKPFCSYGKENAAFLKRVAKTYDPEEVFQKLVPGGFKVSVEC